MLTLLKIFSPSDHVLKALEKLKKFFSPVFMNMFLLPLLDLTKYGPFAVFCVESVKNQ